MTKAKRQAKSRLLSKTLARATYGPRYDIKITKKRGRGRPKKVPVLKGSFVLTLDEMMEIYRQRGLTEREARKCAFAGIKTCLEKEDPDGRPLPAGRLRKLEMETIERYYRWGIEELRPREMRLAQEIDRISAAHGRTGLMPEYGDYGDYGAGCIVWRRYRRGKRALSAARRKQEK